MWIPNPRKLLNLVKKVMSKVHKVLKQYQHRAFMRTKIPNGRFEHFTVQNQLLLQEKLNLLNSDFKKAHTKHMKFLMYTSGYWVCVLFEITKNKWEMLSKLSLSLTLVGMSVSVTSH